MKFPYGICDFNKIITKGYFYCDRTDRIRVLEETGDSLLFLRPRRFEKSLLLSMLANYYAENRLAVYGDALERKYENLRLKRFTVVSLGFERLWAKEYKFSQR